MIRTCCTGVCWLGVSRCLWAWSGDEQHTTTTRPRHNDQRRRRRRQRRRHNDERRTARHTTTTQRLCRPTTTTNNCSTPTPTPTLEGRLKGRHIDAQTAALSWSDRLAFSPTDAQIHRHTAGQKSSSTTTEGRCWGRSNACGSGTTLRDANS